MVKIKDLEPDPISKPIQEVSHKLTMVRIPSETKIKEPADPAMVTQYQGILHNKRTTVGGSF